MPARTRLFALSVLVVAATLSPVAAIAAPQHTTASPAAPMDEQTLFRRLRESPYFAPMTDEQLRQHPLPPGVKSWQEYMAIQGQLAATPKAPSPSPRLKPGERDPSIPNEAYDRKILERAQAGDAAAQVQIGIWSLYGWGKLIPLDERASVKWHSLAAEQRHPIAVGFMSAFYEAGNTVVKKDWIEALKWALVLRELERETKTDPRKTNERIERIKSELLEPGQVGQAEVKARAWLAAHPPRAKKR